MKSAIVLSAILVFSVRVFAQEHPAITAQPNSVYVGADGKFDAAPDTAQIQMNVSVQDDSPQAAYQRASKNVDQVRQVLRANGLDTKLATVGFLSVQPIYEWKPKQRVIGYRVTTDVTLKLKDFSKIGRITQQLAEANVSETQTLNYILENMDEAKNHAVEDAYRRARNSAETVARASGRTLGDLSYASVDTFENPRIVMPRMARAMAAAAPNAAPPAPTEDFSAQSVTVSAHVNALFNLK
ncbi:MAG TPA: SIMPL domain-containing protein [Candidatus Sulfotelmatobacter sp.]|nr:SIMPL domain-containing protein [Candidatus Sulfotelmatobacter sp.]